jgi:thymidine phosphorylase
LVCSLVLAAAARPVAATAMADRARRHAGGDAERLEVINGVAADQAFTVTLVKVGADLRRHRSGDLDPGRSA